MADADGAAAADTLTVEDVVRFERFASRSPVAVSPDGEWVAYTVIDPERAAWPDPDRPFTDAGVFAETSGTALRVTNVRTGETYRPAADGANAWAPTWSPAGDRLAFYSDRDGAVRLWVWDPDERRVRRVSDAIVWTAWTWETPRWTPDGRGLVVKLLPDGHSLEEVLRRSQASAPASEPAQPAAPGSTVRVLPSGESGVADDAGSDLDGAPAWLRWRYGGDLAVVDVESGRVRRLTSGSTPAWWQVSPDGSRLAFTHHAAVDPVRGVVGFRLAVVPIAGGPVRELRGTFRQTWGTAVSWAPDGRRLAYIGAGDDADDAGLFVVDVDSSGERRRLTAARPGWAEPHRGPLWSASADALYVTDDEALRAVDASTGRERRIASAPNGLVLLELLAPHGAATPWSPDGRSVVVRTREPADAAEYGFVRIDLDDGSVRDRATEPGTYGGTFATGLAAHGATAVARFSDARRPPDLWRLDDRLRRAGRVTRLNPAFDPARLGRTRLIEWSVPSGDEDGAERRLAGTLLLPPTYRPGERVPLIVDVYGGAMGSRQLHAFDRHRQLLASRGYAVLVPDAPLEVGSPMRGHARTVLPGVERAVDVGVADPERLGVMGHSYGGYGTLALLVQSDRFDAAVASASHGDMAGMFAKLRPDGIPATAWAERGQGRMGGTPWEVRDRYIDNSPFFFLDRVRTPLLLLHGAEDRNTPVHLAGEIFAGLRRLGRDVVLARYEGEGHWPGSWSLANRLDYWRRVVGWFDDRLRLAAPDAQAAADTSAPR
ncbi:MAG: S9 family peptidase [Gemmatimonadota bacterium]